MRHASARRARIAPPAGVTRPATAGRRGAAAEHVATWDGSTARAHARTLPALGARAGVRAERRAAPASRPAPPAPCPRGRASRTHGEAQEQARLADAAVADEDELEQRVVVAPHVGHLLSCRARRSRVLRVRGVGACIGSASNRARLGSDGVERGEGGAPRTSRDVRLRPHRERDDTRESSLNKARSRFRLRPRLPLPVP